MAYKTKNAKILTFEKMTEVERILGCDGVHTDGNGNYLLSHKDGRIIMISELETIFSKVKGKK